MGEEIIGKINRKIKKEVVLEHWVLLSNPLQTNGKVTKCRGCKVQNFKEDLSSRNCLLKTKKEKILSSLPNLPDNEERRKILEILPLPFGFQSGSNSL